MTTYEISRLVLAALGLIGVAVGVVFALIQIRKTQEWNRRKASQDVLFQVVLGDVASLREELELKYGLDLACSKQANCAAIIEALDDTQKKRFNFLMKKLFNYFETLAIGIKNNVFDEDIIYQHISMVAIRYWRLGKPVIDQIRVASPLIWIEIEYFVSAWEPRLDAHARKIPEPGKKRI